jgi:hypothetical protein
LSKAIRLGFDHVEDLLAESAHELLGVDRPNAPDRPRRKAFLDAVCGGWGRRAQEPRFELLTMYAVIDPFAGRGDPFAGGNRRGMVNHRHEIPVAACLSSSR